MAEVRKHNIDLSKEDGHQYALMLWSQQESVRREWPELALLYHIENERQCSQQQAARRKRMGVKKGVPDLCLPVKRGKYAGLYIELKTPKGRPSPDQNWWVHQLTEAGYDACICYGWEVARDEILRYLQLTGQQA